MSFIDRIHEFGIALGLGPLVPDATGSVSLRFDDAIDLVLTEDPADNAIYIYAELGAASPDAPAQIWRTLLGASLLGAETNGAAFALNGNMVVLWKRHDAIQDGPALEKAVSLMLAQAAAWKENLAELVQTEPVTPSTPGGAFPPTAIMV